ncbi:MAG: thioredoxin [Alphaproteobacteria bacterium]|nr:thioredoxin [Alphaproteobacteria bacterium]
MTMQLTLVVKRDCPTCTLLEPVYAALAASGIALDVWTQDDPAFPESVSGALDEGLERSFRLGVEIVPTLIRREDGEETGRTWGWDRAEWERLTGLDGLGADLPPFRPGCGAKNVEPGMPEALAARFGSARLKSRRVPLAPLEDEIEAAWDRGWSDGLPVVPPTEARVLAMLDGTTRDPGEVLGLVPPNLQPCTVEKVAVNAVMAGCKPEYLPLVLAVVEAALDDAFCMHGVLATTYYIGPIVIVNGPVRRAIGMNAKGNVLGQGNRANATVGRALQLVVRNVGGGKPQGVDRAALGNPGKYTFCFPEDEEGSAWPPLSESRGTGAGRSAVTLFAGYGVMGVVDQDSRTPGALVETFADVFRGLENRNRRNIDAAVVVSPEHDRVFRGAGWSREDFDAALRTALDEPGHETPKLREGGLLIVRAGGGAGMFSAILPGWAATGPVGSIPVTKEVGT